MLLAESLADSSAITSYVSMYYISQTPNIAWCQSSRVSVVVFWLVLLWTPQLYSRPTVQVLVSLVLTNNVICVWCLMATYVIIMCLKNSCFLFILFCSVLFLFGLHSYANLALFPGLPTVYCLITCSMQKTEWEGLVHVIMWMTSVSTSVFWWWVWLNLISRPSHYSVFDHSYHAKTERKGPVHFITWMTSYLLQNGDVSYQKNAFCVQILCLE